MATTSPKQAGGPARLSLVAQLSRFVITGGMAAIVDYGLYQLLLAADVYVHLAKALGFVAGTTTAYLINRRWTFTSSGRRGEMASVFALYGITFVVQLGMNALMLFVLPGSGEPWWRTTVAFVIAQGTATVINFVVQRTLIFRSA